MKRTYLIDSENINDVWVELLQALEDKDEILVFYTDKSAHMGYDRIIRLLEQKRGSVRWIKCFEGQNALDFQLVTELGCLLSQDGKREYVIVSNDTGYDAVVRYWKQRDCQVRRLKGAEGEKIGKAAEKAERQEKKEKAEKVEKLEKAEKPEKTEKPEKAEKLEKAEKPEKPEKPQKAARMEKAERPERPEKTGKPGKSEKSERSGRPERLEREPAGEAHGDRKAVREPAPEQKTVAVLEAVGAAFGGLRRSRNVSFEPRTPEPRMPQPVEVAEPYWADEEDFDGETVEFVDDEDLSWDGAETVEEEDTADAEGLGGSEALEPLEGMDGLEWTEETETADDGEDPYDAVDPEDAEVAEDPEAVEDPEDAGGPEVAEDLDDAEDPDGSGYLDDPDTLGAPEEPLTWREELLRVFTGCSGSEPEQELAFLENLCKTLKLSNMSLVHNVLEYQFGQETGNRLYRFIKEHPECRGELSAGYSNNKRQRERQYLALVLERSGLPVKEGDMEIMLKILNAIPRKNLNAIHTSLVRKFGQSEGGSFYAVLRNHVKIIRGL